MPSATPSSPRVVLGVTGGIAAYKSVDLLRQLRALDYHVAPVLTPDATRFVGAVTFSALASEAVRTSLYGDSTTPIPHTYLGQHCDLVIVAPATAHLIARYAIGLADDLLSATLLATRAPVLLCPAMHTEMWEQPAVQENLATLRRRGVMMLGPEVGPLAGGDAGAGRMVEPDVIVEMAQRILEGHRGPLSARHVVISAGGTREAIDPVRVIANRSSGRQGYALASVAARLGARVTLVSTVSLELPLDVARAITVVPVESADELLAAMVKLQTSADALIMAAAVADFRVRAASHKLKRRDGVPVLELEATPDVLAALVEGRGQGQVIVGFAAESEDVEANAREKLVRKGVDLLVANDVSAPGVGFEHETNEVTIFERSGAREVVSLRDKEGVAEVILTRVASLLAQGAS
ncbi:MAG TPA: bifunctional phosphopantothenoylcysteine decarboxylase/phosphopantothenate--cysteine ligase CoaBC [Acidimicrobiales bacterium]|nr:MAG: phosphopantothenoylcysteine decarboxylase [Actinobacteria bacterium 21-64-8]HQT98937.1 bifunctional phosphopantothenoylcysteine decarboxylase/phosphopantothenate--cysteine ligase CoaBC [Acidimicrobiales bacterium]